MKAVIPALTGWLSATWVSTIAQKYSFKKKEKIRTARAAIAGFMSGITTNQKMRSSLTPSTRAASINSFGSALIKLRMKSVQNPVWNAM